MKILLTLFVLLSSFSLVAKEYKTIFQFKVNIPENYIGVNEISMGEVSEVLKSETDINISEWNSLLLESNIKGGEKIEIFYNIEDLENTELSFFNNIIIISIKTPYEKTSQNDLIEFCPYYEKYLTKLANNKVTQLQCNISSNPGIKGNSVYVEHMGMQPDLATLQYIFWINNNDMVSVTLYCEFYNCAQDRVVFNNLVSSIKY